jgi:hypothetical protein
MAATGGAASHTVPLTVGLCDAVTPRARPSCYSSTTSASAALAFTRSAAFLALDFDEKLLAGARCRLAVGAHQLPAVLSAGVCVDDELGHLVPPEGRGTNEARDYPATQPRLDASSHE